VVVDGAGGGSGDDCANDGALQATAATTTKDNDERDHARMMRP
jgi:hypothetical protein